MNLRRAFIISAACAAFFTLMLLVQLLRSERMPAGFLAFHPNSDNSSRLLASSPGGAHGATEDQCDRLHRTVCSLRGITRDPTGFVRPDVDGEKLASGIYEDIIHANPTWTSDQVDDELVKRIYSPANRTRVETAFRWARRSLERFIQMQPDQVFTSREKRQIRDRLRRIELQLPPPTSAYGEESYLFTKNDVFYERMLDGKMRIRVGGAYFFSSKSWFNMLFTFGHEIAHSIDPCEVRAARFAFPSYDRLSACFLRIGLIATPKDRFECGKSDQLSETFADWMAAHVVADALQSFGTEFHGQDLFNAAANSIRDLCEPEDEDMEADTEFHPPPQVRIERIFGHNPQVRQILGCAPLQHATDYCTFETETPLTKTETPQ